MKEANARLMRQWLRERGQRAWLDMIATFGDTFRAGPLIATVEPELVEKLLMDKQHTAKRSRLQQSLRVLPGADGLLFMDGEPWMTRLKAVMPAFRRSHVDSFAGHIHDVMSARADAMAARGRVDDMYSEIVEAGVQAVLRIGYGIDPSTPRARQLGAAMAQYKRDTDRPQEHYRLDEFGVGPEKLLQTPWLVKLLLEMAASTREVRKHVQALVAEGRADADGWLKQVVATGISEKEVTNELNHLYGAFNAIDFVLTCTLHELANRKVWADAVREEMRVVLDGRKHPVREDLARMPVTMSVMREILRLYPVTMFVARRTGAPVVMGGEVVPKDSEVGIALYALHRHPRFWDRPDEFDPGRWKDSDEPRVPYSYVPFLDGPRKCIGRHLAEIEFVVGLHAFLSRVDLTTESVLHIAPFIVPRFSSSLPVVVRKRAVETKAQAQPSA